MKRLIIIMTYFIISTSIYAHGKTYENIDFKYITEKDGLSYSPINYIFQDSIGYMWLASQTGLMRYDGKNIDNLENLEKLFFNTNTNNISYITSNNSNLYFIKNDIFTILNTKNEKAQNFIGSIYFNEKGYTNDLKKCLIDKQNNIWISSRFGLFKSVRKNGIVKNFKKIIFNEKDSTLSTYSLYKDKYKNLWVGTSKGLFIYNEKADSTIYLGDKSYYLQPYMINEIKEDKHGNIWVGQTKRMIQIKKDQNVFLNKQIKSDIYYLKNLAKSDYVKDFIFDSKGNIWIIVRKSLFVLEFSDNTYKINKVKNRSNKTNGLSSDNLNCISINNEGLVFIGTNNGEINIYDPYNNRIKSKLPIDYNSSFDINCACKDYNGNIWVVAGNHNLFYYITKEDRFIKIKLDINFTFINLFETKQHEIFITSMTKNKLNGGLIRINNTERFYKTHDSNDLSLTIFNSENIEGATKDMALAYFATQDIDNTFWYTVIKEGTYHMKYTKGKMKIIDFINQRNKDKYNLKNIVGLNINILRDSSLYISSSYDKAIKYNRKNNTFCYPYNYSNLVDPKDITNLTFSFLDKKRRHWLGTNGGGLIRYNKNDSINGTILNSKNGLNSDIINSCVMDDNSRMLLGTSMGISIIDSTDHVYNLKTFDGLKKPMNRNAAFEIDSTHICFGGKDGLYFINPSNILNNINKNNAKIGIRNIKINGLSLNKIDTFNTFYNNIKILKLTSSQNNISFKISALAYSNPQDNSLKYRLLPIQEKWLTTQKGNTEINYNNLKNGKYTLQCKVINSNGVTSNITKSVNIFIDKPYYLQWWFLLLSFIFIVGFVYLIQLFFKKNIIKQKNKLQKKVNEQTSELLSKNKELAAINNTRTKMFSVIAHDLIGPLGSIMSTNYMSVENYDEFVENGRLKPLITINNDSLSSLYELLQNLLFWSRHQQSNIKLSPTKFSLYDTCDDVSDFLKYLLRSKSNTLIFDKIPKNLEIFADKQMIHTILRNIISNANKFTCKGIITVQAIELDTFIKISIIDTGIGMPPKKAKELFYKNEVESTKGTAGEVGTGLGLSVSKDFVLKHNGKIYAKSDIGKGTTVTFTISKEIKAD